MSWTVPDYSDIVHLQKYRFHTPHARFSDPDIYVSVQRTRNLQNKVYPSPAPSPTSPSNTSPRFPDYPCKPYPRRYSWKVMLEIYPGIHNEKQQQCKLSHSKNLFLKYNKIPAKYKRKAGNRHGPAILVKLEF